MLRMSIDREWELLEDDLSAFAYRRTVGRRYRLPNGNTGDFDVVIGNDQVGIVAVTDDDHVVLARQYRPGPGRIVGDLPGGRVEADEDPAVAAARELLEETGYAAERIHIVGSTFISGYATGVRYAALAVGCRRVAEPTLDATEDVEVVLLSMDDFRAHTRDGQFTTQDVAWTCLDALSQDRRER